ncbi:class II aldolase/adducin family protein [Pseudomonas sp. 21LCFQ02]|uniref:class II aldolase/adducin family protein n=1 Tax=Pseudomonas sp. 21LCFQ02 TaxID=2957505 RepID=UPI00209B990A|nr:class II aldolase/adducin family protein [Pseudomonas sp. 21LCFQ02]MCO8167515.1 class II aldolase/adducin family protein [Pseudomonas sp. 21LCFQ02]
MTTLAAARHELSIANRILAHEQVFDSYGHVSLRHPEDASRFLLSASVSPEQVKPEDILEYGLDGQTLIATTRAQYSERVIHAEIYRQRPDVQAVVHAHTEAVLPFTVTSVKLRPLLHVAGIIGDDIPVWDMNHHFGDSDLLVTTTEHAQSLASTLGQGRVVLMRGHGFTAAAASLELAVRVAMYLKVNAQAQQAAMALGPVTFLSSGEIAAVNALMGSPKATSRVWDNWAQRCGAGTIMQGVS